MHRVLTDFTAFESSAGILRRESHVHCQPLHLFRVSLSLSLLLLLDIQDDHNTDDYFLRPSLMGSHHGPAMADAGLQARVLDTILVNTYQIFDED